MAAQTTDRLWSSTHVLGAYHGQGPPAAAAPETRDAERCRCCPYGYHIDVDFLNYLNAIKAGSGLSKLKKIHGHRLRQRQAMETQLLMIQRPTSTPPPGGRPGSDSGGTDLSESSGSSSPVTLWSPSEDERDTASSTVAAANRHLMADLDASIADALDSIEALMQPQRTRTTANTMTTGTAAAGSRSVSTGDVYRSSGSVDGQTSASNITTTQVSHGPPSPQSSVSLSSLQDDNKYTASLTSDIFLPTSTQPFSVNSRRASDDSNSQSSSAVEYHRQNKTVGVSSTMVMTTILHESLPSPAASTPHGKLYAPRPPVKPRKAISVGVIEDRVHEDLARETRTTVAFSHRTTADAGTDTVCQLPAAPRSTGEVERSPDPAVDERQTTQHSIISDSTTDVQTTTSISVSTATTSSTNASSFRRQLPVPPKPAEPETSSTTTPKGSSFSSVRALLNRKSGGAQRADAAKVDRPVRRTRYQVSKTAQTRTTSDDVVSEPVLLSSNKTALASDHSTAATERLIQSRENDSSGTLMTSTSGTITQAESKESITTSSCSSPTDIDDIEVAQPLSSIAPSFVPYHQIDHEDTEVSVDALAKAMAILSPIVERPQDGSDMTLDQVEASFPPAVNPEVLMTIRKYIASSLQQMQMLEQQVKLIPMLQLRVSVLKEEKRLLKLQLTKNSSSAKSSQADACVGVTLSELPVAGKESDQSLQLERSNLPVPVERRDVGVGDLRVDINSDSTLYCPSCKAALRSLQSPSLRTTLELSKHEEVETACVQKPESESESVGYHSVSALVNKLQGQDTNHPPSPTRRFRSVEKAVHVSVTSAKDDDEVFTSAVSPRSPDAESSAFTSVRRPRPPVPLKQISIRREEGTNQTTVGVQCTLLKATTEVHQVRGSFPPDLDPASKRMERPEFRAHEPDLVTTHCLGGLSQIEHQLRQDAAYSLKTFADKETETNRTLQHSAAVNTDSPTVVETSSKLYSIDTKVPAQIMDCSINTDISGDICSTEEYFTSRLTRTERSTIPENVHTRSDVRLEPKVHEQTGQQTIVSDFSDRIHVSESTSKDSALKLEVMQSVSMATVSPDIVCKNITHSVKDASCSVDIVTKPITTDASSSTDESLICPLSFDASKLKSFADDKPSVKDAECSADITIKPSVATTACNTETSMDQLREIGCNTTDEYRNNLVDAACGNDNVNVPVPDVTSVGCNTEVKSSRDFGCSTIEEKQPMKDVSCSAVIKLSVCDKSCTTLPVSDVSKTDKADEGPTGRQPGETVTSKDVACLTDSLTTCEMSSNTEEDVTASAQAASVEIASSVVQTGARLSYVETGCVTDILWKPPTKETGCGTDESVSSTEATSLSSVVAKDVSITKPASVTVALNTDAWLLTSDLTFLDTLKQVIRPSVTETASMTDSVERVPTADTSTNTVRQNTVECSSNTDAEIKPLFVSVETLAKPAACDVSCNTEAEDKRREVRDAASSMDIILRPSTSDASVNTDAEAERFSSKPSQSVASNTNTTIHPCAAETAVTSLAGATNDIPNLKDASSATDSLSVCHVSVGTEATSKPLSVDTAAQTQAEPSAFTAGELWSETRDEHLSCGAETLRRQDKEVTAKVDTTDVACIVALRPPLRSVACGIDAEVVNHDTYSESVSETAELHLFSVENDIPPEKQPQSSTDLRDTEAPVFSETREIACNTENMLLTSLFDSFLRLSADTSALTDVPTSTASWNDGEEANVCRLCGVRSVPKPSAATVTDVSPELVSRHHTDIVAERRWTEERCEEDSISGQLRASETSDAEKTDLPNVTPMVMARREVKREMKDTGCDAGRIPTTDVAINTEFAINLLATEQGSDKTSESDNKQQILGSKSHLNVVHSSPTQDATAVSTKTVKDVACGTSDVISPTYEEVCRADSASFQENVVVAASVMADSVTKCPTCLARRPPRDSSCGTDLPSSLLDDLTGQVECAIPSKTVCEVGCNTDSFPMIPSTTDAACNTDSASPTDAPIDVARKPTRIPHKLATTTRRPDAHVAMPDTKDAVCITDIAIAPSDDDEVLKKSDDRERSRTVPSTAEVACNTDEIDNIETSVSVGVEKPKPLRLSVRTVGCSTDPTSANKKPSTRDAGCTARPQTKAQSCVTDPMPSQPVTETPVKAAERTRTGLQVTRVKSQTVTTVRSSNTLTPPPSTSDAPALAAAKSPTFDVACGTDLEFHSKYFNMDDGGLLHQLSADDVAEVLLLRRPPSLSLTSPTCDVACNTEYDSRPCTPARVNYSGYYASAATDPPPPTAADVSCGPDTPSAALCDVGCGTEDLSTAMPFQTSSDVNTAPPPTTHIDIHSKLGTDSRGTTLPLPSTISQQQFVLEPSATNESVVGRQMTETKFEVDLSLLQNVNLIHSLISINSKCNVFGGICTFVCMKYENFQKP